MNRGWLLLSGFIAVFVHFYAVASTASESYESARAYFQAQKWRAAEIELRNSLQNDASYIPSRLLLGQLMVRDERWADAKKELQIALQGGAAPETVIFDLMRAHAGLDERQDVIRLMEQYNHFQARAEYSLIRANLAVVLMDFDGAQQLYAQSLKGSSGELADEVRVRSGALALRTSKNEQVLELTQAVGVTSRFYRQAQLLQAEALLAQSNSVKAIERYEALLKIDTTDGVATLGLARSLHRHGEIHKAMATVLRYREKAPEDPYGLLVHAALVGGQGKANEQRRLLRQIQMKLSNLPETEQQKEDVLLLAATLDYSNEQYESAILKLRRALKLTEQNYQIHQLLAQCYLQLNDHRTAERYAQIALKLNSADSNLYLLVAAIAKAQKDFASELNILQRAHSAFPAKAEIRQAYVQSLLRNNHPEQAKDLLSKSSSGAQADRLVLGYLQLEMGEFDQAKASASSLLKADASKVEIFQFAGDVAAKTGDIELAKQFFEQALVLDNTFKPSLLSLASIAVQRKNWLEAIHLYKKMLKKDEKDPLVLQLIADAALRLGDTTAAIEYLKKIERTDVDSEHAQVALVQLYMQTGQTDKAKVLIGQLKGDGVLSPDLYFLKSNLANLEGKRAEVIDTNQLLYGLWYEKADRLYQLADFQVQSSDLEGLVKTLSRLAALDADHRTIDVLRVKLAIAQKEYGNADRLLSKLERREGKSPDLTELRAHLWLGQGKRTAAATLFAELFQTSKDRRHLFLYVGLQTIGSVQAKNLLAEWLVEHPDDVEVMLLLAQHLTGDSNQQELIALYEKSPLLLSHPVIQNNLASLLLHIDPDRALVLAEKAYQVLPDQVEVLDTYGVALVKTGDVHKGLGVLRDAEIRQPSSNYIQMHIAYALESAGRKQEAADLIQLLRTRKLDEAEQKHFAALFEQ